MSRNEWRFAGFILVCVLITSVICFVLGAITGCVDAEIPEEETPIIYDSVAITESKAYCPECGNETVAFNDEIVCRNEDCPNYGLAVSVNVVD